MFKYEYLCLNIKIYFYNILLKLALAVGWGNSTLNSTVKHEAKTQMLLGTRDCVQLIHHKCSSYQLKLVLNQIIGDRKFYYPITNSQMIQS